LLERGQVLVDIISQENYRRKMVTFALLKKRIQMKKQFKHLKQYNEVQSLRRAFLVFSLYCTAKFELSNLVLYHKRSRALGLWKFRTDALTDMRTFYQRGQLRYLINVLKDFIRNWHRKCQRRADRRRRLQYFRLMHPVPHCCRPLITLCFFHWKEVFAPYNRRIRVAQRQLRSNRCMILQRQSFSLWLEEAANNAARQPAKLEVGFRRFRVGILSRQKTWNI
jgi:hypothetical protein